MYSFCLVVGLMLACAPAGTRELQVAKDSSEADDAPRGLSVEFVFRAQGLT